MKLKKIDKHLLINPNKKTEVLFVKEDGQVESGKVNTTWKSAVRMFGEYKLDTSDGLHSISGEIFNVDHEDKIYIYLRQNRKGKTS